MLEPYFEGLATSELRTTRCTACRGAQFPPRMACPHCSARDTGEWIAASGLGRVWSFCTFHKAYFPRPAQQPTYVVAVVELHEGSKLISNIIGAENVEVGMPVKAVFVTERGEHRVVFESVR